MHRVVIRRQALKQGVTMTGIGGCLAWWPHTRPLATLMIGLACLILALGFLFPAAFRRIDGVAKAFGRLVGQLLTWVLLVPFYYLFFVPARVARKLGRHDPLRLRFPRRTEPSFWVSCPVRRNPGDYRKEY